MPTWNCANEVYSYGAGHCGPTVLWLSSTVAPASRQPAGAVPNAWHVCDLKPLGVAADALWARLAGHVIITHGTDVGLSDLTLTVRPPGSQLNHMNYQLQAIAEDAQEGARGNQSVAAPLVDGCFEFYWRCVRNKSSGPVDPDVPYPTGGAYLVNLWLEQWGRYSPPSGGGGVGIPAEGITVKLTPQAA